MTEQTLAEKKEQYEILSAKCGHYEDTSRWLKEAIDKLRTASHEFEELGGRSSFCRDLFKRLDSTIVEAGEHLEKLNAQWEIAEEEMLDLELEPGILCNCHDESVCDEDEPEVMLINSSEDGSITIRVRHQGMTYELDGTEWGVSKEVGILWGTVSLPDDAGRNAVRRAVKRFRRDEEKAKVAVAEGV